MCSTTEYMLHSPCADTARFLVPSTFGTLLLRPSLVHQPCPTINSTHRSIHPKTPRSLSASCDSHSDFAKVDLNHVGPSSLGPHFLPCFFLVLLPSNNRHPRVHFYCPRNPLYGYSRIHNTLAHRKVWRQVHDFLHLICESHHATMPNAALNPSSSRSHLPHPVHTPSHSRRVLSFALEPLLAATHRPCPLEH